MDVENTYVSILYLIFISGANYLSLIDLEINFIKLFSDSSKYFGDILE